MKKLNYKRKTLNYFLPVFSLVAGAMIFAMACSNSKAEGEKDAVTLGKETFESYCTLCHGEKADGKGNMASVLTTAPMDLTTIAKRRDGVFPDTEISKIIAGVEEMPGHSSGEMPAWWETFKKAEGTTDDKVVQEKIDQVVAYLKTIQQ